MNIVNNIWKKAPFKSDSQENNDLNSNGNLEQQQNVNSEESTNSSAFNIAGNLTGNLTGQVSGGVSYVSNMFKSTFKSDGEKSRKESLDSTNEPKENVKKESLTTGATNLMNNVWSKSTSLFNREKDQSDNAENTKTEDETIQYNEDAKEDSNLIDNQKENVSQKAIDSAKNFGNFMVSFANKASTKVIETAKQINLPTNLLSDFTKEQQEFIKEHGGNIAVGAEPPWVDCEDEENMKEQILSLSQDKRNFVRAPPSGVQFDFDLQQQLPICLVLLKEDANLNKMRYEIVPKLVNEESFWRNYFYRVSLIKNNSINNPNCKGRQSSSEEEYEGPDDISPTNPPEFVSDQFQGNVNEEDLVSGMKQMGVSKKESFKDDSKWEKELLNDLQEFEVVNKDCNDIKNTFDAEFAKDLEEIN